jgi:hypothetical protein
MATIPSPYKLPSLHLTHILVYIIYIHTVHTYTLYIAKYVRLISSIVDFPTRCSPLIMKRCLLVYHPFNVISPPFLPSKSSSSTNLAQDLGHHLAIHSILSPFTTMKYPFFIPIQWFAYPIL